MDTALWLVYTPIRL